MSKISHIEKLQFGTSGGRAIVLINFINDKNIHSYAYIAMNEKQYHAANLAYSEGKTLNILSLGEIIETDTKKEPPEFVKSYIAEEYSES